MIKFSRIPDAKWTERDNKLVEFRLQLQETIHREMSAESEARERVLREFVVGPAVPVARTEAQFDGNYPPAWGVVLDDGSIAWFRRDTFIGWNTLTPWSEIKDDND